MKESERTEIYNNTHKYNYVLEGTQILKHTCMCTRKRKLNSLFHILFYYLTTL